MQVDSQCTSLYKDLRQSREGPKYLIFKMDSGKAVVDKVGPRDSTFQDFVTNLPKNEARWAAITIGYQTSKGRRSKIVFVSWIPSTCNKIDKMTYAMFQGTLRAKIDGVHCVVSAHSEEDITPAIVLERAARHEREEIDWNIGLLA